MESKMEAPTPADKAKEIGKRYYDIICNTDMVNFNRKALEKSATLCAIQEVKAVIRSNPHSSPFNTNPVYSTMKYYEDILSELEKMQL